MAVYFVQDTHRNFIKVGRSSRVKKRLSDLQTGNPYDLLLMGWIESPDDPRLERELHMRFKDLRHRREWFELTVDHVLGSLKEHNGFVPKNANAFEIDGFDKDGVPEYVGVCSWATFEIEECCPFCGCLCGMYFNEAASMYHCLKCDALTDFSELEILEGREPS